MQKVLKRRLLDVIPCRRRGKSSGKVFKYTCLYKLDLRRDRSLDLSVSDRPEGLSLRLKRDR